MANDVAPESDKSKVDPDAEQTNTMAKQKKPYVKPAFRYEKVFVTTALSCGKLSGTCNSMTIKVS